MLSKSIALIALSATAAVASPFHKRHDHSRWHNFGSFNPQTAATPAASPDNNDTNPQFMTQTVSPLPQVSAPNKVVGVASDSSSCDSTSYLTSTSINFVTVTASPSAQTKVVEAGSVSAGAFYNGGRSWTRSNAGQNTAPAVSVGVSVPAPSAPAPSAPAANPSTTFMSVPSAAKSSAAVASSSAAAAAPPSTGSSGGKRGISFNDASLVAAFGSSVSWSYNWAATEKGSLPVEFVPMMWGQNDVSSFASNVGSATHVLSFNEPDLGAQSNIDPVTAAKLHKQGMASLVGKVEIGSPAITNGAGSSPAMGTTWLDQFFTACGNGCPVDFVAYHWYATADSFDYFKQHTQDVIDVAKKYGVNKVWLTEFQPSGSSDAQAAFMKQAVAFLDSTPEVERYAAFMASDGTMLSGGSLNAVGSAYASA